MSIIIKRGPTFTAGVLRKETRCYPGGLAIDGTWRRPCTVEDVSDTGAKLTVDGSIEGLNLKDSFCCYRRWEMHTGAAS